MNWNIINDENNIKYLMNLFNGFHDSCIKEIKYISGAFIDNKFSMCPFNNIRNLSTIFQSQNKSCSAIEIIFKEVDKFNLRPKNSENYTCELWELLLKK